MKNLDLKDKKVKGALVVVGAIIGLAFLYINLFGSPTSSENRNDKEVQTGESASFLNFNVPTIKDTVKSDNLSSIYEKNRRDSMTNARLNEEAMSYSSPSIGSPSYSSGSSSEKFSNSEFESMRISAIKNSHNTYGTSDMWSSKPSVDVGYSDMGNVISTPVRSNKRKTQSKSPVESVPNEFNSVEVVETPSYTSSQSSTPKVKTKEERLQDAIAQKYGESATKNVSVKGQIFGEQMIGSQNNSVRIILSEKLVLNGTTIGTDANIYGIANVSGNNVSITIPNISYKGKNFPVNLKVYDYRTGQLGIPINLDNIVGAISERGESTASSEISRYGGKVGSILTSVFSGRNKNAKIQLNSGHQIYLKSENK